MVNGKAGDSPLTDIVHYGRSIFDGEVDELVRRLFERGAFENSIAHTWLDEMANLLAEARRAGSVAHGTIVADEAGILTLTRIVLHEELRRLNYLDATPD